MSSKRLTGFLFALVLASLVGCRTEREQQRHVAEDILAIAEAATQGNDIPPISDQPGRYGRGEELVRYMRDRYSRLSAQSLELGQLMRKSDAWTNPREWSNPGRIKALRKEAERATWLINENLVLIEETTGAKAISAIRAMNMSSHFKQGVIDGMKETGALRNSTVEMLTIIQNWTQNAAELLSLVDERLEKMDRGTPKFSNLEDAEAYHRLIRKGNELKIVLKDQLPRFLDLYKDAQLKLKI